MQNNEQGKWVSVVDELEQDHEVLDNIKQVDFHSIVGGGDGIAER